MGEFNRNNGEPPYNSPENDPQPPINHMRTTPVLERLAAFGVVVVAVTVWAVLTAIDAGALKKDYSKEAALKKLEYILADMGENAPIRLHDMQNENADVIWSYVYFLGGDLP